MIAFAAYSTFASHFADILGLNRQSPSPVLEIQLKLRRSTVFVGDTVRLRETYSNRLDLDIMSIDHDAIQIGQFDEKTGQQLPIDLLTKTYLSGKLEEYLGDLPDGAWFGHGLICDVNTPDQQGIAYEFKPAKPGIYLISANWHTRSWQKISGPPVVLTVRPARVAKK
jgi:hypothetical protein